MALLLHICKTGVRLTSVPTFKIMTAKKQDSRIKSAALYTWSVKDASGYVYADGSSYPLNAIVSYMDNHLYCFADRPYSYHKFYREIKATGGAFTGCFASRDGDSPIFVSIVCTSLLPVAAFVADEYEAPAPVAVYNELSRNSQRYLDKSATSADVSTVCKCLSCDNDFFSNGLFRPRFCVSCMTGETAPLLPITAAKVAAAESATSAEPVAPVLNRMPILVPLTFREMTAKQQAAYVSSGAPQFAKKANLHAKECTCLHCSPVPPAALNSSAV